jgi:hypothetical protein
MAMKRLLIVGLGLGLAACEGGGGGPVTPGRDLSVALVCQVCGVGTYTIRAGNLAQMSVQARSLSTGQEVACPDGTWTSSVTGVATVVGAGKSGTVRGVSPGLARIRVELACGAFGNATVESDVLVVAGNPASEVG